MKIQDKVKKIYEFIEENLYLCLPDIEVDGRPFNSTLMFEILSCLNDGKQILFGEYGLGKTTSSEYVVSLIDSLPRQVVLASEIKGHPEQTEEKMVGRPDLGKLNNGIEKVIWSYFVSNPTKIVDEFNRLPAAKQNILLDGIDRGSWKYLSDMIMNGDFTLFATCNYEDLGNSSLIEPMLDRFDVATESKKPSLIQMVSIKDIPSETKAILDDKELAERVLTIYDSKDLTYQEKLSKTAEISDVFREKIQEKTGLELLTAEEKLRAKDEINKIQFSSEAELFYIFVMSELTSCQEKGMKRANENCNVGCHYSGYACSKTESGLSVRSALAIAKYAKTLAWLNDKEKVSVEEVDKILPYVIWHKMSFSEHYKGSLASEQRTDPLELYTAKKIIGDIKERFVEQAPALRNYVCMMRDGKTDEASNYIKEMDHPVFKEIERHKW